MTEDLQIVLPANFAAEQEQLILKYLTQGRRSLTLPEWRSVLAGFDSLHKAQVIIGTVSETFKQIYESYVERPFADYFIAELIQLSDVPNEAGSLRARIARQIVKHLEQSNLRRSEVPATNLLLSYCLYFWEAFALGYAFEVEIYRDLTDSSVAFQAHDIRDRQARLSPYDLLVLELRGDIKTSMYFLYTERGRKLAHDFYVTRFYEGNLQRTLVVLLKPLAWEKINGDTVSASLEEATKLFPEPVKVQIERKPMVIIDYNVWKTRVFKLQQTE